MDDIRVSVERISIPAWSTIGYGFGRDDQGRSITFVGDHRPMRTIGEQLGSGEPVEAAVPITAIIEIEEPAAS